jgi:hypothetical protein
MTTATIVPHRPTLEQLAERVELHLADYGMEGNRYAQLTGQEMEYETQRTVIKSGLINMLLGTENAATYRPHSADSAEKAATVHPKYQAHQKLLSQTVVGKIKAETAMHSARLRAQLAIALIRNEAGVA